MYMYIWRHIAHVSIWEKEVHGNVRLTLKMPFHAISDWRDTQYTNKFLVWIPLKWGAVIIGIFGVLYGFIGLYFFFSMSIRFNDYKAVYINKLDLFAYLYIIFIALIVVFFVSLVLLFGVYIEDELCLLIHIYGILSHLAIIWFANMCVFLYCLFARTCFGSQGVGYAAVTFICGAFYSFFWLYLVVCVNCYLLDILPDWIIIILFLSCNFYTRYNNALFSFTQ